MDFKLKGLVDLPDRNHFLNLTTISLGNEYKLGVTTLQTCTTT